MNQLSKLIEATELPRRARTLSEQDPTGYFKSAVESTLYCAEQEGKPTPAEQELIAKLLFVLRDADNKTAKRVIKRHLAKIKLPSTPTHDLKRLYEYI